MTTRLFLIAMNTLIFLILSGIHVYWAMGGTRGARAVVPTSDDETPAFMPGIAATLSVAFGLLLFATATIGTVGVFDNWVDRILFRIGGWVIGGIFSLRAVGDFNKIGFTKKIKHTPFALNDTRIYSPLCVFIATVSLLLLIL